MARLALISDVHLGTRQYGLPERYEDFLESFRQFGRDVIRRKPDAVIIGGDLFDSPRPDARSVNLAQCVVREITEAGIRVFGIDGNHDLADGWWLRTIGAGALCEKEALDINGALVTGIPYRSGQDLVDTIREMADAGMRTDVLVAHFALLEMNGGGNSDTGVQELSPLLERLGCRLVLMGHVHIPDVHEWNGITFVNPGSTEMKSSNEPPEKFWMEVDSATREVTPVPLKTRKVETVDIATESDLLEFSERLKREAALASSDKTFYQVIASDSVSEIYGRVTRCARDNLSLVRVTMRPNEARDLAPAVDRSESVATLESAIEARFPKGSEEATLTATFLHSPEPAAIHLVVDKFMKE